MKEVKEVKSPGEKVEMAELEIMAALSKAEAKPMGMKEAAMVAEVAARPDLPEPIKKSQIKAAAMEMAKLRYLLNCFTSLKKPTQI